MRRAIVIGRGLPIWIAIVALSLPARADSGKDAYKKGVRSERHADYDAAFGFYKEAHTREPNNAAYFAAYTRIRFNVSTQHVRNGQMLRNTGALADAMKEFERAVEIDGSNFIAQQERRRTADMMRRQERRLNTPKIESPLAKLVDEAAGTVELRPISDAPISLRMTANADVAYKTICKLAGLNVVIDQDFRPQKITVELTDVTLREALDMVRLQSKSFWRPMSPNTIFVAPDSAAKRKELEPNVMKTFYLRNITSPNELQEAGNMLRQILDISRVQLMQEQDALILRGTPDQMVLAEKLLADYDKPKAEVLIDVCVMQVSRDRIRTLGTNVPTSASMGAAFNNGAGNGSGTSSGNGVSLKSLPSLFSTKNLMVSIPGASFTILSSDSNTKILQNPEIRALNNQKATLRIGDRVPIATGSFQPGVIGGGGVSPLVSTQFQYLDVGVNIDITPHIHADGDVTLKMGLEISSVTGTENIGGITQPIIGQRRIEHESRLADGDVNLLGGILEETETKSLSGYPWVSKIPILRYLFAQENRERQENEIVFAITPHVVRSRDVTEENLRTIEVGTGNAIELRWKTPQAAADAGKPKENAKAAAPGTPAAPRAQSRPAAP